MKTTLTFCVLSTLFFSCNNNLKDKPQNKDLTTEQSQTSTNKNLETVNIKVLLSKMLLWVNSQEQLNSIPAKLSVDSLYTSIDFDAVSNHVKSLEQSKYFTNNFIENYQKIFKKLDSELKNDKSLYWQEGELSPFNFMGDVNPWILTQDIPYDSPNPYENIEIIEFDPKLGTGKWKWKASDNLDDSWKSFTYKFRVYLNNNTYKIDYLEGFDLNNII